MGGTLQGFQGYERDTNMFGLALISSAVTNSRNTSVVDPEGGVASCRILQGAANTETRQALPTGPKDAAAAATIAEGERWGFFLRLKMAIDPTTAAANFQLLRLAFASGTARTITLCARTSDGLLEWYENTSSPFNGEGSATGTAGTVALDDQWHTYWIDLNFPVSGTSTITCYLDYTADASCTPDTSSNGSATAAAGGRTGATAPGDFIYVDNVVVVKNIDGGENKGRDWAGVVLGASPDANGDAAWQDFSVVNAGADTQHYQAVDEQAPDSTDYVHVTNGTSAADELENIAAITTPTSYPRPVGIVGMISHINNNGGKWSATHNIAVGWDGSTLRNVASLSDPSTGYQTRAGMTAQGRVSSYITISDISGLQVGPRVSQAEAADTAAWRVRTIAAEVLYGLPQIQMKQKRPAWLVPPPPPPVIRKPFIGLFTAAPVAPYNPTRRRQVSVI